MGEADKTVKDVSIALVSTSALLLTILAVTPSPIMTLAVYGLYSTIGMGAIVFFLLIVRAHQQDSPNESASSFKVLFAFVILQIFSFAFGLGNTLLVLIHR